MTDTLITRDCDVRLEDIIKWTEEEFIEELCKVNVLDVTHFDLVDFKPNGTLILEVTGTVPTEDDTVREVAPKAVVIDVPFEDEGGPSA